MKKNAQRLPLLRSERLSLSDRLRLAEDTIPGTEFDGFFEDCAETWAWLNRANPRIALNVRGEVTKRLAAEVLRLGNFAQDEKTKDVNEFIAWAGCCLVEICVKGESQFLRDMASAIDGWKKYAPALSRNDKIRSAILLEAEITKRLDGRVTVRRLRERLKRHHGLDLEPSEVRPICKELNIQIQGEPGRPKK